MGGNQDDTRETSVPSRGFDKWYENTAEIDLARQAAAAPLPEDEEEEDRPSEPVAEEWIPPASIVKAATTRRRSTAADRLPCSLPASKSPEGIPLSSCTLY